MSKRNNWMLNRPASTSVGVLSVVALAIIVYGALAGLHRDTITYVTFVAPILTTLVGLLAVAHQVENVSTKADANAAKLDDVQAATNGKLDQKFADLREHVTEVVKDAANDSSTS